MAWVTPSTQTTGTLITANIWNQDVVENTLELKDPPSSNYEADESADYTTSSTSLVDVDAGTGANTKFYRQITTTGGDVMVHFHGTVTLTVTSHFTKFDVDMDGSPQGGDDGFITQYGMNVNYNQLFSFTRLLTGVSADTHDFKLQWRVSGGTAKLYAGAGTANMDSHPQFWVREVS